MKSNYLLIKQGDLTYTYQDSGLFAGVALGVIGLKSER